eukprot:g10638.t1
MDLRGVKISVLQSILQELDSWRNGKRYLYGGKSGVQLADKIFQSRVYKLGSQLVRTTEPIQVNSPNWAKRIEIKAAVGDRVRLVHGYGAVVKVCVNETNDIEYYVRPVKREHTKYSHEVNHSSWTWGDVEHILRNDEITRDSRATTKDACEEIVKPKTKREGQSFVDFVEANNENKRVLANDSSCFVSHAWSYEFRDVVESLNGCVDKDDYLWFDIVSVNQHKAQNYDFEWWKVTFRDSVNKIGKTLLVMSPWSKPLPLTRAWCLWELYCTVDTKSELKFAMTRREETTFLNTLQNDFEGIAMNLCKLDTRNAEAGRVEDQKKIAANVQENGFLSVNKKCQEGIKKCLCDIAKKSLMRDENNFKLNDGLANLLREIGQYREAEKYYKKALEGRRQGFSCCCGIFRRNSLEGILASKHYLAWNYMHLGDYEKAREYAEEALEGRAKTLGPRHKDTFATTYILANILSCQGGNMGAVKEHYKCILNGIVPTDEIDTNVLILNCKNELGSLLELQGRNTTDKMEKQSKFDESLKYIEEAKNAREKLLGYKHDHTLDSYNTLANLYHSMGKFDSARRFYLKAIDGAKEMLGLNHNKTITYISDLASLLKEVPGNYGMAKDLYEEALKGCKVVFSVDHNWSLGIKGKLGCLMLDQGTDEEKQTGKKLIEETLYALKQKKDVSNDHRYVKEFEDVLHNCKTNIGCKQNTV